MSVKASVNIYHEWKGRNSLGAAELIRRLGLFVSGLMIVFDSLFVAQSTQFVSGRIVCILLIWLGQVSISKMSSSRKSERSFEDSIRAPFAILWPLIVFNLFYLHFTFVVAHEKFNIYFTGLLLTTLVSTFLVHRFAVEQLIYNGAFSLLALSLAITLPQGFRDKLYIVVILHLSLGFLAVHQRRQFVKQLHSQLQLLKTMVPEKVALYIVAGERSLQDQHLFQPKSRFSVCLCADWRGSQKLAMRKTPAEFTSVLENYYDLIMTEIKRLLPEANYYFNWNADELFIVFFNEENDSESVIRDALTFAFHLAGPVYATVQEKFNDEIVYDVGLADGVGVLGLLGPKDLKKTTIYGEVAGRAKRMEQEGKRLRKKEGAVFPRLIMSKNLHEKSRELEFRPPGFFKSKSAVSEDLKGEMVWVWQWHPRQEVKKAG